MTDVDKFMAGLHNRMPVMLVRGLEDAWPDHEITKAQYVLNVLSRSTSLDLDAHPGSRMVNRPSVDRRVLIQPVE
jgi:putative SOS response-associated peptidase YedK